jgi:hypothetical protein
VQHGHDGRYRLGRALGGLEREEAGDALAVARAGRGQEVDQHQGPLPLPKVTEGLLAVDGLRAREVEDVVADLERGTEEEPEPEHRGEVDGPPGADQGPDAQRQQGRVPAGLLHDQVEVVVRRQVGAAIPLPSQLARLAVDCLAGHEVELRPDPCGEPPPEQALVVSEGTEREHGEPVARVDREGPAVPAVQRGLPPPQVTVVLDVVMDEEGGVEQLDRGR